MPFKLNIGDAPLTREQQARLIDIIYDHTEVFSLFDRDLGFCDILKHSIPTTTDKQVYLPHRQIPVQLQSEVRKCLDNWLDTRNNMSVKKPIRFTGGNLS